MSTYILIRFLLLVALGVVAWMLARPVRSASSLALRRLGIGVGVGVAVVAILFPALTNQVARLLGVERGVNLLVYGLVIAFLVQMVSSYRRDAAAQARITQLARAIALASISSKTEASPHADSGFSGPISPTKSPDADKVKDDE